MDIRNLVDKLNPQLKRCLEEAAGLCLSRTHFYIEPEHFLLKIIEKPDLDLSLLLAAFQVSRDSLRNELNQSLEQVKRGNLRAPSFSEHTVSLMREALTVATVEFQAPSIRSIHLVYAIANNAQLARLLDKITIFSNLDSKILLNKGVELCSNSQESLCKPLENEGLKPDSNEESIKQFCTDLTAQAKMGKIDPITGRDEEIRKIVDILLRRRQNNPILTGEAGVGKTAIAEGLALHIVEKKVPQSLQNIRLLCLDLALLQAGASVKGEFEQRLKQLVKEVKASSQPVVLFIDEAHTLIGAGGSEGTQDAANILKPALARGELRTVAATTWDEYKKYFEKDPALTRRFQVVKVDEPSVEQAVDMMRRMVTSLEKHHEVLVTEKAVRASVELSKRFIAGRQLPDKCLSLLDTACARVKLSQTTEPAAIQDLQARLANIAVELHRQNAETKKNHNQFDQTSLIQEKFDITKKLDQLRQKFSNEQTLVNRLIEVATKNESQEEAPDSEMIQDLKRQLQQIQLDQPFIFPWVDEDCVAQIVEDWTGIPAGKMTEDEIEKILSLRETLKQKVIGQDLGIELISKSIKSSRSGVTDENRPIGVFLLTGPSGVGKTETAISLAEELYGSADAMTVINMSEFKEEHKVSLLLGSPPGYVGYGEGGILTEAARRKPYSLILLDEVEKAHKGVQDVFYQLFDKGSLRDGEGRDVNFRNTVVILTSNLATDTIVDYFENSAEQRRPSLNLVENKEAFADIRKDLLEYFKPAFLGRVEIIPYLPLTSQKLQEIAKIHLKKVEKRVQSHHGVSVSFDASVSTYIATHCNDKGSGARNIHRIFDRELFPALSDFLLKKIASKEPLVDFNVAANDRGFFIQ